MRDQEAVQRLRALEQEKGTGMNEVATLIELAPFLSQPRISSHIELNKSKFSHIKDLLLIA